MRIRFPLLLLTLVCAVLPGRLAAQRAQQARPPVTVPDTLDAYIEGEMEERRIPGLALAIARRGDILTERAYGLAGVQNDVPVTTDTRFALASLTKQFTAAGVMMLVEEGRIDLDASILRYLPEDAPERWQPITPRHLLTHTSGLPPIGEGFSGSESSYDQIWVSTEESWAAARADTLYTRPGTEWAYSDVGFFLLGMMTQHVSGPPWRAFMRGRILDPLEMSDTFVIDQIGIHRNLAQGYTLRDGALANLHRPWQYELPSHFGLFSTVGDLAKWDAALYTDRLLSEESRRTMWTPVRLNDGSTHPYGFGWEVIEEGAGGYEMLRHTGITGTEIVRVPGATLTVIVLTNLGRGFGGEANSWGIARQIAQTLLR
jgi:CubicO group peptidase (beta-lactamase class C family)